MLVAKLYYILFCFVGRQLEKVENNLSSTTFDISLIVSLGVCDEGLR